MSCRLLVAVCALLLGFQSVADAQIIQAVNRFANAGEPEENTNAAVEKKGDDKGMLLLSQASAQAEGGDNTQIALQAVDLWMSRKTRFYARLTLPVKAQPAEKTEESATPTETEKKPSDAIVKQLVDPFGGIVNVSGGYFGQLRKPGGKPSHQEDVIQRRVRSTSETRLRAVNDSEPVKKAEEEARAAVEKMQPDHGAFLDLRAGIKLIDLPNPGSRAVAVGETKLNVFYTGIAGVKAILPLYKRPVSAGDATKEDLAGGLTLGAYLVANRAADVTQSDIFSSSLNRSTRAFTAVVGINLPGIAGLSLSLTPWTNDKRMGKVFVFGFEVLRPTKNESES
jgi:hypothetical protein